MNGLRTMLLKSQRGALNHNEKEKKERKKCYKNLNDCKIAECDNVQDSLLPIMNGKRKRITSISNDFEGKHYGNGPKTYIVTDSNTRICKCIYKKINRMNYERNGVAAAE